MEKKQIPFNLETVKKVQAGEIKGIIRTRDGRPARFLGEIKDSVYPLVFAREIKHDRGRELSDVYTLTGRYSAARDEHDSDIIIEIEDEQQKTEYQLKPFEKVLARDRDDEEWKADFFSRHYTGCRYDYECVSGMHIQCIPYAGNENLLGTTDKPKEG